MEALTQTSTGASEAEEARTDKAREERDRRRGGAKEGADARVERRRTAEERRQEDRTAEEMVVAVADIGDHCGRARSGWMAVGGGRKPTSDDDDVTRVPSPLYRRTAAPRFFYSFTCVCTCESEEKFRFPARGSAPASPRVLFPTPESLFSPEPSPISSHPPHLPPPRNRRPFQETPHRSRKSASPEASSDAGQAEAMDGEEVRVEENDVRT